MQITLDYLARVPIYLCLLAVRRVAGSLACLVLCPNAWQEPSSREGDFILCSFRESTVCHGREGISGRSMRWLGDHTVSTTRKQNISRK